MSSIEEKMKAIISEELGIESDTISMDSVFDDDLGADSLTKMELMMAIEDQFGLDISDENLEKIKTVQNAVDYIRENSGDKG